MESGTNFKLQSEHPRVRHGHQSPEAYALLLIHQKAYEFAATLPHKRILDWGCNNGYGMKLLQDRGHSVAGLDVSSSLLDEARKLGLSELYLLETDTMQFSSQPFDMITSFQVIEHVVDYDAYIGEVKRHLQPEGVAVFTTPNAAIRLDEGQKPWSEFHVREFRGGELRDLLGRYFRSVTVSGLFACPKITQLEMNRSSRARRGLTSASSRRALIFPRRLPNCTTECLYYSDSDLDSALDLMAICKI